MLPPGIMQGAGVLNLDLGKLSDSRIFFFGALVADTACMGSLAILLFAPSVFSAWPVSKILLAACALTVPVVMLSAFVTLTALREKMPVDEKVRRAIVVASVMHGMTQAIQFGDFLVLGKSRTLDQYMGWSAAYAIGFAFFLNLVAWMTNNYRRNAVQEQRRARRAERQRTILAQQLTGQS